jgi:hypothetical protein
MARRRRGSEVNRISERNRPLVIVVTGIVVVLIIVGAVLVVGRLGPSPAPSTSLPPSATTAPSSDPTTPEGAVRAFFGAFKEARRTDDPALIRPYVTTEQSSAYLSVQGFLLGQKAVKKASVLTVQTVQNLMVDVTGDTATARLVYTEGGYDISLDTGEPLESPNILAPRNITMELRRVGGRWLVESYEAQAQ